MPVIINDFEVIEESAPQPTGQTSQQPAEPVTQPRDEAHRQKSLARRLRRLQERRARLHAD